MINKIILKNFQSHENSSLNLHDGMNVIVGPSDSGKTAIIRALKWLFFNKPSGDAYRRIDSDETVVTIEGKDEVARAKTNRENTYILNTVELRAFGTEVPEAIQKALQMSAVNLQEQMDSPFLLGDTSGSISQFFNRITKLDKIDTSLQYLQKEYRATKNELDFTNKQLIDIRSELTNYHFIEEVEAKLTIIEQKEKQYEDIGKRINLIRQTITQYKLTEQLINGLSTKILPENEINKILGWYEKYRSVTQETLNLKGIFVNYKIKISELEKLEKIVVAENLVNKILELYDKARKFNRQDVLIRNIINNIQANKSAAEKAEKALLILEEEFRRDFPEYCPLCNTKIK